jgi:HEAT repeat protein
MPAVPGPPARPGSLADAVARAAAARDRVASQRERIAESVERAQDAIHELRGVHVPELHVQVPDIHIPDLDIHIPQVDVHVPEFDFAFDHDFDFDFAFDHDFDFNFDHDFDFARDFDVDVDWHLDIARNAAAIAGPFAAQAPVPLPARAPQPPQPPMPVYADSRSPEGLYDQARGYIDRDQYERALQPLDRLIALKTTRSDAAMYWKAYSLSKLSRNAEALTTLAELRKQYGNSSWIRDAGFLELEVRQSSGQSVNAEAQVSEDMKLIALQGIMRSDPATAIPVIEKTLAGNSSIRVKERALFVLSQSREARAREVITGVAKGSGNPDLRAAAVRYLGRTSGPDVAQSLEEIYRSTADVDVKRAVLQALSTARATDRLGSIARNEKDPELRRSAVRYLGSSNTPEAAEALRAMYTTDSTTEVRRAVIDALSSNRNGAAALVSLARAEKDQAMKMEIVRRLSNMRAPEAQQYLVEILK